MMNWLAVLVAAFIPLIIGFIWYNEKVLGKAWMKETGMTNEKAQEGNMILIFGLSFLFSIMLSMALTTFTIHQSSVFSLLVGQPGFDTAGSELDLWYKDFMNRFGSLHRTFSHGVIHGLFAGIFFATPVLAVNAMFEQRSWKYILINAGYWIICAMLMGGILCAWQ